MVCLKITMKTAAPLALPPPPPDRRVVRAKRKERRLVGSLCLSSSNRRIEREFSAAYNFSHDRTRGGLAKAKWLVVFYVVWSNIRILELV